MTTQAAALFQDTLKSVAAGQTLTADDAYSAFTNIMQGHIQAVEIASFLSILTTRGETIEEITGAAKAMREQASAIQTPPQNCIDCCGTGGDAAGTLNISTAVAFVLAACGLPVAKHGNRAASSKSGAADVLEALGVPLEDNIEKLTKALNSLNFCFLMAPHHHTAMKHVAPVRKALGFRTIFNILGPLANPAGVKNQLIGVYDKKWMRPMAEVLKSLGAHSVWIVHGRDGLDEITITDKTDIIKLNKDGSITEAVIGPNDYSIPVVSLSDIAGGDAAHNAAQLNAVLTNAAEHNKAYADIICLNAGAALTLSGISNSVEDGIKMARESLKNGKAHQVLSDYIDFLSK